MTSHAPGRLAGDACDRDPIWDRDVETEAPEAAFVRAAAAWEKQFPHLMERSGFYSRRFREAGVTGDRLSLKDITRLPFSSKAELKQAIDQAPPFGSNLCVTPAQVKRVYQTSGTTGIASRVRCV